MKSVRIEPNTVHDKTFFIGIECSCGNSCLANKEIPEMAFKHSAVIDGRDVRLVCKCGKKYLIHPQATHFHIFTT